MATSRQRRAGTHAPRHPGSILSAIHKRTLRCARMIEEYEEQLKQGEQVDHEPHDHCQAVVLKLLRAELDRIATMARWGKT